ncbi:MAG: hypothetical protein N2654_01265 [Deltaproteobacteria bacterium]|nr:hypothetical protein [Deltaproteobacteria bacterium]
MSGFVWSTRIGLAFAAAGSAVGLGNFLRFPGQAYVNGGGAFLIPYIICFFLVAIPLCWLEWSLGRLGGEKKRHSCAGIFDVLIENRLVKVLSGALSVLIPAGIYSYYALVQSWCLAYFFVFSGVISVGEISEVGNAKNLFESITKSTENGFNLSFPLACLVLTVALNALVILRGFINSIEKFCTYAIPLMAVCAFIILFRVLTLGTPDPSVPDRNVWNALGFMWNPRGVNGESWFASYFNPQVWLAAFGQVFFSLSVGFGILMHYASYVKRKEDIALTSFAASATNGSAVLSLFRSYSFFLERILIPTALLALDLSRCLLCLIKCHLATFLAHYGF